MRDNHFYEALMEGRYPLSIDIAESADGDSFRATYISPNGVQIEVEECSRTAAQTACMDQIREAVRQGTITPFA